MSRRNLLRGGTVLAATALGGPFINRGQFTVFADTAHAQEFSTRAVRLVEEATVIDMLCPLSIKDDLSKRYMSDPSSFTAEDFEFYRGSGINLWHDTTGAGDLGGRDDHEVALIWAAAWNGFLAHNPQWFLRVTTPEHLDRLNDSGRIGYLLGLQNSTHFRTPDDVNLFRGLGQMLSQLTYNSQNRIGTGCMDRRDGGISDFGAEIVQRMNEVGMAVDVAHCGDQTTLDAFEISNRPVLMTHTNARKLNPGYLRNKTDEAIRKMAKSGGVLKFVSILKTTSLKSRPNPPLFMSFLRFH
jgi:membrane dipeptidase